MCWLTELGLITLHIRMFFFILTEAIASLQTLKIQVLQTAVVTSFWSLAWKITFQFQKGNEKILFSAFFFFHPHKKATRGNVPCKKRSSPQAASYLSLLQSIGSVLKTARTWNSKLKFKGKKRGGGINSGNVFLPCRQTVLTTAQRRKRSQSPIALYKKKNGWQTLEIQVYTVASWHKWYFDSDSFLLCAQIALRTDA